MRLTALNLQINAPRISHHIPSYAHYDLVKGFTKLCSLNHPIGVLKPQNSYRPFVSGPLITNLHGIDRLIGLDLSPAPDVQHSILNRTTQIMTREGELCDSPQPWTIWNYKYQAHLRIPFEMEFGGFAWVFFQGLLKPFYSVTIHFTDRKRAMP